MYPSEFLNLILAMLVGAGLIISGILIERKGSITKTYRIVERKLKQREKRK